MKIIRALLPLVAVTALAVAACGGDKPSATQSPPQSTKVSVTASEPAKDVYKFDGISTDLSGGVVEVSLKNAGKEPHDLQIIKVDGDRTLQDVLQVISSDDEGAPIPDWLHGAGGAGTVAPDQSTSATQKLTDGKYIFLCTLNNEETHKSHAEGGMAAAVTVKGGDQSAALPAGSATITAKEDGDKRSFDVPPLKAGSTTIEFKNSGKELHHVLMLPIVPGKTIDDVKSSLMAPEGEQQGPPPVDFEKSSGTAVIDGGMSLVTTVNLSAGNYAFVCFLPDRQGGPPHAAQGMLQEVKVG